MNFFKKYLLIIIIGITLIDIHIQYFPIEFLLINIFLGISFYLKKPSIALVSFLFIPEIIGGYFYSIGIDGLGGYFLIIAFVLSYKSIFSSKFFLKDFFPLLIIITFLYASTYLLSGESPSSLEKLNQIAINGFLGYLVFYNFFKNLHTINLINVSLILIVLAAFVIRLEIDINNLPGPSTFFDFGFMRIQTQTYGIDAIISKDDFSFSYHKPGFLVLIAFGLLFFKRDFKINSINILILLTGILIAIYSGARQNIFAIFILASIKVLKHKNLILTTASKYIFLIIIFSFAIFFARQNELFFDILNARNYVEFISSFGRMEHYFYSIDYFNSNPFSGVGVAFHDYGIEAKWPHNLFLEILSETGIFGIFTIFSIIYFHLIFNRNRIDSQDFIFLFLPFFIRSMISLSLSENILLISLYFSVYYAKNKNVQKI